MMKTCRFALLAALLAVLSCEKPAEDQLVPPEKDAITFNFTFDFPTKAKKDKWEDGDVIFVFLNGAPSPQYLKMSYNSGSWSSQAMNGASACASLEIGGNSGHMRAVYLPFGGDATITNNAGAYQFSTACQSLFWTDDMDYTVVGHSITANFNMHIPDGYVQFYVAGTGASDGDYTLSTDAVIPTSLVSVNADLTLNLQNGAVGAPMPGYVFHKDGDDEGLLFSGRLNEAYASAYSSYYFAKTGPGNTRADYFITPGSALGNHDAVTLPANNSAKWQSVGRSSTVAMVTTDKKETHNCGTWYTCSYNGATPEEWHSANGVGVFSYSAASGLVAANRQLPTNDNIDNLLTYCTWTKMSVHENTGFVVKAGNGNFLFFPAKGEYSPDTNEFWAGTNGSTDYCLQISHDNNTKSRASYLRLSAATCQIRFVTGN